MISSFLLSLHPIQNLSLYTPPYSIKTVFTYVRKKFNLCSTFPLKYLFSCFLPDGDVDCVIFPITPSFSHRKPLFSLCREKKTFLYNSFSCHRAIYVLFHVFLYAENFNSNFFHLCIFFKKQSFNNET